MKPTDTRQDGHLPNFLRAIIEKFCSGSFFEEFVGDLEEVHNTRLSRHSSFWSTTRTTIDVLSLLRIRFRNKPTPDRTYFDGSLTRNYVRIAWRNVSNNQGYAIVNIFGLAVGLAWLTMNAWLDNFAVRIQIGVGIFLITGLFALAFGITSVGIPVLSHCNGEPVRQPEARIVTDRQLGHGLRITSYSSGI